ncbi:MAG: hypothetical protein EOM30_05765 [Clostridia bacterium]|nr:hypothetical protein [Clostridia bacterium]NLS85598.1 hypothetical protein [Oscillospiraceae bacterium]
MTKKFLALLTAVMMCALFAQTAFAAEYEVSPDIEDWDAALTQNPAQTQPDETPYNITDDEANISGSGVFAGVHNLVDGTDGC